MCVRVAIDLKLFDLLSERSKTTGPVTAAELAETSGAERLLIGNYF